MPVTATEVHIRFRPAAARRVRPRAGPSSRTRCGSGSGRRPRSGSPCTARSRARAGSRRREDSSFAQQPGSDMRPYDRLIGAALDGDRWLFARQDTVEAAWRVVDPVLGDVVPVHPYARGSWGPKEADRLLPGRRHLARPGRVSCMEDDRSCDQRRPAARGDRRRRLRRAVRRPGAAPARRSQVTLIDRAAAPPVPAAALPVRDRDPVRGPDRGPAASAAASARQRRAA